MEDKNASDLDEIEKNVQAGDSNPKDEKLLDESVSSTTNSDKSGCFSSAGAKSMESMEEVSNISINNFISSIDGDKSDSCGDRINEWKNHGNSVDSHISLLKDNEEYEFKGLENIRSILDDQNETEVDACAQLNYETKSVNQNAPFDDKSPFLCDLFQTQCDMSKDQSSDDWPNELPTLDKELQSKLKQTYQESIPATPVGTGTDWSSDEEIVTKPPAQSETDSSNQIQAQDQPQDQRQPKRNSDDADGNNNIKQMEADKLVKSFNKFGLNEKLMDAISSLNLDNFTKFQENLMTSLKGNQHNSKFITAPLYSNKEVVYLIRLFERMDVTLNKTQAVIVLPITEIVEQVYQMALPIAKKLGLKVKNLATERSLSKCDDHLVVTTLKLLEHALLKKRCIDKKSLKAIVFDEFDMLLTFRENSDSIHNIINHINTNENDCQIIYFSSSKQDRTVNFVQQHSNSKLTTLDLFHRVDCLKNILHFYVICKDRREKEDALVKIVKSISLNKVLIFSDSKAVVSSITTIIKSSNVKDYQIFSVGEEFDTHSRSDPHKFEGRSNVLHNFKATKKAFLICQYPLAVNLNIGEVNIVINYRLPRSSSDIIREYYHRAAILTRNERPSIVINLSAREHLKNDTLNKLKDYFNIKIHKLVPTEN